MAIEFRCQQCGKLLRVGDETSGKQAKCPSCGAVQTVPAASSPPAGLSPQSSSPFAAAPNAALGGLPPAFESDNPYAAPASPMPPPAGPFYDYPRGARTGPPWERDGASFRSFFETVKLTYSSADFMFSDMRREGGVGAPLGFGLAGAMAGGFVSLAYQLGFQALALGMGGAAGGPAPGGAPFSPLVFVAVAAGIGLVALPLAFILHMFVSAGIFHLMLLMLGGARQPFETTFRVVAYSTGSASLLLMIPMCGQWANTIAQMVFIGIGLCRAHEISGGKAAAAVLLPFVVCCLGVFALVFGVIYAVGP